VNFKKKLIISSMGLSLMLGGCSDMNNAGIEKETEKQTAAQQEQQTENVYVSVQDYKGEGYELDNGEKTDKIAESYRKEIDEAVKAFFQNTYKTEVKVHNVVGAADGATVFVESVGEPHFYTFAIVPIDIEEEKVLIDKVWSQEGQVEDAIMTGLFAMIFDKEIAILDQYMDKIVSENQVTGFTEEALQNVRAGGFSTPYYYINTAGDKFDILFDEYLKDPQKSSEDWKNIYSKDMFEPEDIIITVYLYMEDKKAEPDKEVFNKIVSGIEKTEGLPKGAYSVYLNDNLVDKRNSRGVKDNSLEKSFPSEIIRE
jgi:hypothetical protein